MKKVAFIWIGIFLFAAGCTDSEVQQNEVSRSVDIEEIEGLKKKISELENQISKLENQFSAAQEEQEGLEQMIMSHDGLGYGQLRRSQQMLEDLISHLPEIDVRTGYIKGMEKEWINIDFAEMVVSAEAPNGFEIINESEKAEAFAMVDDVTIFVLNGTDFEVRTKEEYIPANPYFFEFYIADGKVIQMREVYLP